MKSIIVFLMIFSLNIVSSKEYCALSKNSIYPDSEQIITFDNHYLSCADESLFLSSNIIIEKIIIEKSQLKIIRANKNELKSFKILASSHGYHLVDRQVDCQQDHCQHMDIIALDDFKSINKYTKQVEIKGSNSAIQQLVDLISPNLWLADVVTLSSWNRVSGTVDNNSAKTWIESKFNDFGLQTLTQSFTVSSNQTHNIIATQTGILTPNNWYIVGAHMDSIPSLGSAPGAVDNASGCAGVLEMARIASQYDFASSIIYICFSGEEQGLIGSYFHANSIINAGNQSKVKAVLTMDMIGYTSNSQHELLLETSSANQWLMDLMAQNAAIYAPDLTIYTSTNPFGSDHVPYINNAMHGILSIDDDWNVYPAYHQSNDLPENLNLTQGKYILKTNLASLAQLAEIQLIDEVFANGFE